MRTRFLHSRVEEFIKYNSLAARHYQKYKARRHQRFGEPELRLLPFLVPPDRTALDVGANKGIYTSLLAELAGRVIAFEPNPLIGEVIERAFPSNVEFHNIALSDKNGSAELVIPRKPDGRVSHVVGSLRADKAVGAHASYTVPTRRLDDLNIGDVGFMKIDVEGFERQVLDGGLKTVNRDKPKILIEFEERYTNRPIGTMIGEIEALGYAMMFLHRGQLHAGASFDAAFHHDPATKEYVKDFIFFPTP